MKRILHLIGLILTLAALAGCGGDDGSTPTASDYVFPAGTATLTFSAMSTAQLPASVSGIDFTLALPVGMNVTTTTGGSGQIVTSTLTPGSALSGTNLAYGNYSASTRKAYLTMATTSDSYRSGEFLRLACTVGTGTSLTLSGLQALNTPVTIVKAVGYDALTNSTVDLTDKLAVSIGAVR